MGLSTRCTRPLIGQVLGLEKTVSDCAWCHDVAARNRVAYLLPFIPFAHLVGRFSSDRDVPKSVFDVRVSAVTSCVIRPDEWWD
jgi:hypothetical protein